MISTIRFTNVFAVYSTIIYIIILFFRDFAGFFAGIYRDLYRDLLLRTVVVLNELHIEYDEVFHLPAKEVFDF